MVFGFVEVHSECPHPRASEPLTSHRTCPGPISTPSRFPHKSKFGNHLLTMATTWTEAQIELAIADLAKQNTPNIAETSRRCGVPRKMLSNRFNCKTVSQQEATSEHHQCLTSAQEDALVALLNHLTNRGLPPTNAIVKNLAEEIIGRRVGKSWSSQFCRRHQDRLTSLYLKNIDKKRQNAEYLPMFKQFYDLVTLFLVDYAVL